MARHERPLHSGKEGKAKKAGIQAMPPDERKSEPQTQTSESAKGKPGSSMRGLMKRSRISLPYALPASNSSCRSGGRRSSGGGLSSGGVQRMRLA